MNHKQREEISSMADAIVNMPVDFEQQKKALEKFIKRFNKIDPTPEYKITKNGEGIWFDLSFEQAKKELGLKMAEFHYSRVEIYDSGSRLVTNNNGLGASKINDVYKIEEM